MELHLNADERLLLMWLQQQAKGFGEAHRISAGDGGFLEATEMPRERYEKAEAYLTHFNLAGAKTDGKHAGKDIRFIWLTPDGELYFRSHQAARNAEDARLRDLLAAVGNRRASAATPESVDPTPDAPRPTGERQAP